MTAKITNPNNILGIEEGDEILMPEPTEGDDNWMHGDFIARVYSIWDDDGIQMATVIDQDDDAFDISLDRLVRP